MRILLVALALVLSGCTTTHTATLAIDFADEGDPVYATLAFHPESAPAQAVYDAKGATHPGYYHVVDLLEAWAASSGTSIAYQYYDGLGLIVESIGTVQGTFDNGWWWAFYTDGEPVCDGGISTTPVTHGMEVGFRLVPSDAVLC